jgi:single-strand DNA-binding protein
MANFNFNKVILGGRLTADVERKTTPSGVPVASFTIAVNRRFAKDGETDFINCVAWRQTADFVSKFFSKGSSISVVGSIQVRSWNDKDGQKRYATEVVADEAYFVDGKNDSAAAAPSASQYVPDQYKAPSAPEYKEIEDEEDLPF